MKLINKHNLYFSFTVGAHQLYTLINIRIMSRTCIILLTEPHSFQNRYLYEKNLITKFNNT